MKKTFCFFFLLVVIAESVKAQSPASRFKLIGTSWEFDKRAVLEELMQFDDKEANLFWPVYNKYMRDWSRLMNYRIYTIYKYSEDFKNMTPRQTSKCVNELFVNDVKLTQLQKKTYKKVEKALSQVRASQFMQLEYALQLVLLSEMQQRSMSVGDLMKKL